MEDPEDDDHRDDKEAGEREREKSLLKLSLN
jgi:hypothetical protein